jgi:hypothetical protein
MIERFENAVYAVEDITDRLRKRFPQYLKPEVASVRIVQTGDRVWLEITIEKEMASYLVDQYIKLTDLGFIGAEETRFFDPEDSVSINASKFVDEFGPLSISNTTDLFREGTYDEIDAQFHRYRKRT